MSTENKAWFQPNCTGSASDEENVGPTPRAFHVAVAIDCHMFVFGGRSGRNRFAFEFKEMFCIICTVRFVTAFCCYMQAWRFLDA